MGIEPTSSAWKAEVLPLNYTRLYLHHPFQPKFNRKTQLIFYFTYLYKVAKYFLHQLPKSQQPPQNNLYKTIETKLFWWRG